jgi:hypothetical protein
MLAAIDTSSSSGVNPRMLNAINETDHRRHRLVPWGRKHSKTPADYSGQASLRRKQCYITPRRELLLGNTQ